MQENPVGGAPVTRESGAEKGLGLSRRSFIRSMAAAGAAVAFLSSGTRLARAQWNQARLAGLTDEKLKDMYEKMLKIRQWETTMKDLFVGGKEGLYGSFHLYVGEEACAVGAIAALNDDDYIASTHRGHGHLIAKGGDLKKMSAEIYFRATGYNKGYGGSMHITDMSKYILGMNGIVGSSYPLAAGAAYGAKVRGTKQVAVAFGGDGSVASPYYHSALRNAALYRLALIAFVENNHYQISVPVQNAIPVPDLSITGQAWGIPGVTVDGNDVLAVYSATKAAVERARAGEGPTVIEAKTYRWYDHAGFAGAKVGVDGAWGLPYRPDRELRSWMAQDPIMRFRTFLLSIGVLSEREAAEIAEKVKQEVDESVEFARNSPPPRPEDGLYNVYAQGAVRASQFLS